MQRKVVVIPKAAQVEHQKENIGTSYSCNLDESDVKKIEELKAQLRLNAMPCRGLKFACFEGLQGAPFCSACT